MYNDIHPQQEVSGMKRSAGLFLAMIMLIVSSLSPLSVSTALANTSVVPLYVFPLPGSSRLNPETSLIVRYPGTANAARVDASAFNVTGELSGVHTGSVVLSDDQATVVFTPGQPFTAGERVDVKVSPDWASASEAYSFSFEIEAQPHFQQVLTATEMHIFGAELTTPAVNPVDPKAVLTQTYLTLPPDFPVYTVNQPAVEPQGYYFLAPILYNAPGSLRNYLLIVDNTGQPVFYQALNNRGAFDFKKQPNGLLTYFDNAISGFQVLNSGYQHQTTITAKNGYTADPHDFHILPNNHVVFLIYDTKIMDMSKIIPGGDPQAQVTGLVIQELDGAGNVYFQWRSWDYFLITDTNNEINLLAHFIDYVHGNAIELDWDGNYLLSSRHLSEITKINRTSGGIMWRLGGKHNQFNFTNVNISQSPPFSYQHDIRRLANGDITLFDNRNFLEPLYSRAVEYQLNEDLFTATQVWEYRSTTTGTFSGAMGDSQRLFNGNTVIGWGLPSSFTPVKPPDVSEVTPDGSLAFQLTLADQYISYRAFRFDWKGYPTWAPTTAFKEQAGQVTIGASWNGDTEAAQYVFYGGTTVNGAPQILGTKTRTGFETQFTFGGSSTNYCYFEAMPLDKNGVPMEMSTKLILPGCLPYKNNLPIVSR
jgi:hypothetical protein